MRLCTERASQSPKEMCCARREGKHRHTGQGPGMKREAPRTQAGRTEPRAVLGQSSEAGRRGSTQLGSPAPCPARSTLQRRCSYPPPPPPPPPAPPVSRASVGTSPGQFQQETLSREAGDSCRTPEEAPSSSVNLLPNLHSMPCLTQLLPISWAGPGKEDLEERAPGSQ